MIQRAGSSLSSIVELWEIVAGKLRITTKQAAAFTEQQFVSRDFYLWVDDEHTGLWSPLEGENAYGNRVDLIYLKEAWDSAEAHGWNPASYQQWKCLKIELEDFKAIEASADRVRGDVAPVFRTP
jgi:hypothetical protein